MIGQKGLGGLSLAKLHVEVKPSEIECAVCRASVGKPFSRLQRLSPTPLTLHELNEALVGPGGLTSLRQRLEERLRAIQDARRAKIVRERKRVLSTSRLGELRARKQGLMDFNGAVGLPPETEDHAHRGVKGESIGLLTKHLQETRLRACPVTDQECLYGAGQGIEQLVRPMLVLLSVNPGSKPAQTKEHGKGQQPERIEGHPAAFRFTR